MKTETKPSNSRCLYKLVGCYLCVVAMFFLLCTSASPKSPLLPVIGTAAPHTAWHLQLKVLVSWEAGCLSVESTRHWQAGSQTPLPGTALPRWAQRGPSGPGGSAVITPSHHSNHYKLPRMSPSLHGVSRMHQEAGWCTLQSCSWWS